MRRVRGSLDRAVVGKVGWSSRIDLHVGLSVRQTLVSTGTERPYRPHERTPVLAPCGAIRVAFGLCDATAKRRECCILVVKDGVALSYVANWRGTRMEVVPGVFVTAASTEDWQSIDHPAGEIHVLCSEVGLRAGLWRSAPGRTPQQLQWTAPTREVKIVLEGTSRIEIVDGPTLELKAGDMASLPKGAIATWSFSPDYKEMWVLAED